MRRILAGLACAFVVATPALAEDGPLPDGFKAIQTIVVVYFENRSFVNLLPDFPGAFGIAEAPQSAVVQRDRDGSVLPHLPPVWLTDSAIPDPGRFEPPTPDPAYPASMPNAPFLIGEPPYDKPADVLTPNPVHEFYQNQRQINGGRNDAFVAWTNVGSLTMGTYEGKGTHLYALGREFTVADRFFMGAFGGSSLNHFYLACACSPRFESAPESMRAVLGADGNLKLAPDSPKSALDGPPKWVRDGSLSPDGYVVNTVQPPYQPSAIPPAKGGDPRFADPAGNPLPPQTVPTLGDRLSDKGVDWAWYAQGWDVALAYRGAIYNNLGAVNFQPHHQPYNYFANYAPGTKAREEHLKDMEDFWEAAAAGKLPAVAFVKPDGNNNQHPGESTVAAGDDIIGTVVDTLRESPQWDHMAIIVTHDENGGFWDPVPPPAGDRWGPGSRVPTIIVSPFAKKGFVDHTVYDTTSILAFISKRFGLDMLPGIRTQFGDLRNAFAVGAQ
jgi:acid phosphatase